MEENGNRRGRESENEEEEKGLARGGTGMDREKEDSMGMLQGRSS
jgi:hypothetical protein